MHQVGGAGLHAPVGQPGLHLRAPDVGRLRRDDLVEGCIRLMNTGTDVTGPINLGNPSEFTMIELAKTIVDLTGSASKFTHLPLPADDPRQRQPDVTKARELLDWAPKVDLREGLARTIAYFDTLLKEID